MSLPLKDTGSSSVNTALLRKTRSTKDDAKGLLPRRSSLRNRKLEVEGAASEPLLADISNSTAAEEADILTVDSERRTRNQCLKEAVGHERLGAMNTLPGNKEITGGNGDTSGFEPNESSFAADNDDTDKDGVRRSESSQSTGDSKCLHKDARPHLHFDESPLSRLSVKTRNLSVSQSSIATADNHSNQDQKNANRKDVFDDNQLISSVRNRGEPTTAPSESLKRRSLPPPVKPKTRGSERGPPETISPGNKGAKDATTMHCDKDPSTLSVLDRKTAFTQKVEQHLPQTKAMQRKAEQDRLGKVM